MTIAVIVSHEIISPNANCNLLHPTDAAQGEGLKDTIRVAGEMGGWFLIEHEDVLLKSLEWLEKSVALPQDVMPATPADFKPRDI